MLQDVICNDPNNFNTKTSVHRKRKICGDFAGGVGHSFERVTVLESVV